MTFIEEEVSVELRDTIAIVTLTRPGKRNALSDGLMAQIEASFARLPDTVGAAVLNGGQCAPMDRLALAQHCGFSSPVHGTDVVLEAQRAKLQRVVETAREASPTA